MYDSDEVRDAVRRDALVGYMQRVGSLAGLSDLALLDRAAVGDALAAEGDPWQRALREYLEEIEQHRPGARERFGLLVQAFAAMVRRIGEQILDVMKPIVDKFLEVGEALLDALAAALRTARPAFEALGLVIQTEKAEPPPFVWQRRPRTPQVRPAHPVDAVAAGRQPAAWFRTRIRGGRR